MPTPTPDGAPLRTMQASFHTPYIAPMLRLLTSHGAIAQQVERAKYSWLSEEDQDYQTFLITFPEGTRHVDLVLIYTVRFTIQFPDGAQLHGAEAGGVPVLYLPAEEVE
jgi:hypothetical protein